MSEIEKIDAPPDLATCIDCRYPLRGLTNHACPECGRHFDPNLPSTMRVPGAASAREARRAEPRVWNFNLLHGVLATIVVFSSWFAAPHPLPTLVLLLLWLRYEFPHFLRMAGRRRLINRYGFPLAILSVDESGVRRLRRLFSIAFVVTASQLPFFVAYAVSYPFLARSAHHWWIEVPANENPPKGWTIRGVLPVRIDAGVSEIRFQLPSGSIRFKANDDRTDLIGTLHLDFPR